MATAIVTGAAGGIGRAVRRHLDEMSYRVIGVDMVAGEAQDVALDVADPDFGSRFSRIVEDISDLEVLVNAAARYEPRPVFELPEEEFDLTMTTNVRSVFVACRTFAHCLQQRGHSGAIVNLSSAGVRNGSTNMDYVASKGAVEAMTISMGKMWGPSGVRVNAVAPGPVNTAMGARVPPAAMREYLAATPLRRIAEPDEIAAVIAFLASPKASYINAQIISICGGRS